MTEVCSRHGSYLLSVILKFGINALCGQQAHTAEEVLEGRDDLSMAGGGSALQISSIASRLELRHSPNLSLRPQFDENARRCG
jgi:hypothetical protein